MQSSRQGLFVGSGVVEAAAKPSLASDSNSPECNGLSESYHHCSPLLGSPVDDGNSFGRIVPWVAPISNKFVATPSWPKHFFVTKL